MPTHPWALTLVGADGADEQWLRHQIVSEGTHDAAMMVFMHEERWQFPWLRLMLLERTWVSLVNWPDRRKAPLLAADRRRWNDWAAATSGRRSRGAATP